MYWALFKKHLKSKRIMFTFKLKSEISNSIFKPSFQEEKGEARFEYKP